jgi:hypothetical protein
MKCYGIDGLGSCEHNGTHDEDVRWCDACEEQRREDAKKPMRLTAEQYKEAAYYHFFE